MFWMNRASDNSFKFDNLRLSSSIILIFVLIGEEIVIVYYEGKLSKFMLASTI